MQPDGPWRRSTATDARTASLQVSIVAAGWGGDALVTRDIATTRIVRRMVSSSPRIASRQRRIVWGTKFAIASIRSPMADQRVGTRTDATR